MVYSVIFELASLPGKFTMSVNRSTLNNFDLSLPSDLSFGLTSGSIERWEKFGFYG
jgi:hypothetical protein